MVTMKDVNKLIFQQDFTTTDTIDVNHGAGNEFIAIKVIVANEFRSDLIEYIQFVDVDNFRIKLISDQTGYVQIFESDLITSFASGAVEGVSGSNYVDSYDTRTQS